MFFASAKRGEESFHDDERPTACRVACRNLLSRYNKRHNSIFIHICRGQASLSKTLFLVLTCNNYVQVSFLICTVDNYDLSNLHAQRETYPT
jgi:hypothetical protein